MQQSANTDIIYFNSNICYKQNCTCSYKRLQYTKKHEFNANNNYGEVSNAHHLCTFRYGS